MGGAGGAGGGGAGGAGGAHLLQQPRVEVVQHLPDQPQVAWMVGEG